MQKTVTLSKRPDPLAILSSPLLVPGYMVGYARVSTDEQILDVQLNALKAAGCHSIYEEKVSGAGKKRPQLDLAIKELQPGDTLVVWRLDRLARSMEEFHRRLKEIRDAGATFKSLTESFDFNTAMGEFVLVILAAVAQLERQITVKRTQAGMAAAKARGRQIGAPVKFTPQKKAKAKAWIEDGAKHAAVAKRLDLSPGTITAWVKKGMPL
jgi:DNA invertase Pin-like site-specific DNA recombinase